MGHERFCTRKNPRITFSEVWTLWSSYSSPFVHRMKCLHIIFGGTRASTFKMANACPAWSIMVNGGRRNRCCSGRVIVTPWGRPCWHSRHLKAWRGHQSMVQVPMTSPHQLETTSTGKSNIISAAQTRTETPCCWFHSRSEANHSTFHHWRPLRQLLRWEAFWGCKHTRKRRFHMVIKCDQQIANFWGKPAESFWQIDKQPDMVTVNTVKNLITQKCMDWTGLNNFRCLPPSPMPYSAWSGEGLT